MKDKGGVYYPDGWLKPIPLPDGWGNKYWLKPKGGGYAGGWWMIADTPFKINSGYRCWKHNKEIDSTIVITILQNTVVT